jgi:pimeloyl-ACP methyl ester carboxylesterase
VNHSEAATLIDVGGGVRLAVWDRGEGPAVVLLHGWPVTSFHWRLTVPTLVAAGFRAICADLRGLGASSGGPQAFEKEGLARDVIALADCLSLGAFAMVGHDWGGTVAYLVAVDHPARVTALAVEEELLPGSGVAIPEPGRSHYPDWHAAFNAAPGLAEALAVGREDAFHGAFLRQSAGPAGLASDAERAYLAAYRAPEAFAAGLGYYRTGPADAAAVAARASRRLAMPVLTVGGERGMGFAVRDCFSRVAADLRHVQVPEAGHYPAEQRAERVVLALVGFLRDHACT